MFKSGFITMIGRANVGKSTLLNAFLEQKVSIVSDKPNTTKKQILGIYNDENCQLVFVDTPGFFYKKISDSASKINFVILKNIDEIDIILFLVNEECSNKDKEFLTFLQKYQKKIILVISKMDLLKRKILIDKIILSYLKYFKFEAVIPVSSLINKNLSILKGQILNLLESKTPYFPRNTITNLSQKEIIVELLREKLFFYLDKELPHVCRIFLEKINFIKEKDLNEIYISILVPKLSQKKILIGKEGSQLKKIRLAAQKDIQKNLKMKNYLNLWVKTDDIRNNNKRLTYK
ncbi:GTPase [Candidatus Phytoplasma luffae]|uniref:GTPase Era n=1 Tax=Loofah witches'-broom phytoplasma TaxID=35773 RepID=A0A975FHY0_LOWBP|nr:GTPase Era [Candidatus Phytoplasma luffae]QTX02673.1 GTPase [Candidatus Phytoplasma luffae]